MHPQIAPTKARVDDAAASLAETLKRLEATRERYQDDSADFFYKLALLDAGALAASATFLGNMFGRSSSASSSAVSAVVHGMLLLQCSWACLLVALLSSYGRNFCVYRYGWYARNQDYFKWKKEYSDAKAEMMRDLSQPILERYTLQPLDRAHEILVCESNSTNYLTVRENSQKWEKRFLRASALFERVAVVGLFLGLFCLVEFAVFQIVR